VLCAGIVRSNLSSWPAWSFQDSCLIATSTLTMYSDDPRTLSDIGVCKVMCKTKNKPHMSQSSPKNSPTASGDA
jgi:hypothetical protein